jgi:hypothetical protein
MTDPQEHIKSNAAKINELNATQRFTMWSVFKLETPLGPDETTRKDEAAEVEVGGQAFFRDGGVPLAPGGLMAFLKGGK